MFLVARLGVLASDDDGVDDRADEGDDRYDYGDVRKAVGGEPLGNLCFHFVLRRFVSPMDRLWGMFSCHIPSGRHERAERPARSGLGVGLLTGSLLGLSLFVAG